MKELSKLATIPQPFYAVTQYGKAVMIPAEDGQWLKKTAVAESFLALAQERDSWKQRAEAAESNYANEHDALKQVERNYELLEAKLTELEKHPPMAYRWESPVNGKICYDGIKPLGVISQPLYLRPAPAINLAELVPDDYFSGLVNKARTSADKAMLKFPQPNYVLLKVAEEAGEVVQAGVHYAENRMTWQQLEGEIVQLLAMLIRLVTEGDQVNGITPPEECRAAILRNIEEQLQ